ncbi:hypothetical protein GCM10009069_24090 [Algimonas arctica]|uniref:Uncharacterized protein n=1 Tax=Algimonas arctica TaxID=1479486 RepID=A0A8J3CU62_9PROT|nr:hypothetical protein [Algimonas arctica]GHB00466.1 hypothetical protein GCM10009069_24090 [Algimonas arctica]
MVRASLILSCALLAISAMLGALTFNKVDGLNPLITENGLYINLRHDYRFILNLDKTADQEALISAELDFSNRVMTALMYSAQPELKNHPFVVALSEAAKSEGQYFKDKEASKLRLQSLNTPAKMVELASLLSKFDFAYYDRVFDYYLQLYRLVRYLLLSLSLLALSIGTSFISFEMVRRKTA